MLRNLVLGLAVLLTLCGALALGVAWPAGVQLLVFGVLLLVGTVFERVRYKRLQPGAPPSRFVRTPERFRDEASGAAVTVYADPATGERAYVRD